MRAGLEDAGILVREAGTVSATLSDVRDRAPDVVLIDNDLCRRDDTPLLATLKGDPDLFSVAVVLLTDAAGSADALRSLDQGAQDIVILPAHPADLVARVKSAARTKALQEEVLSRGRVMEDLVYGDPLTRLSNRRFILGRISSLVAGARRHGRALSVAMIDIDHFKSLNDELGHSAGDAALIATAGRMANRLRTEDDLGRLGGEEFLAILPDTCGEDAAQVAEDLREAVGCKPMILEGQSRTVTISVGWATWDGEEDHDALLKRADEALYNAKAAGRDRIAAAAEGKRVQRRSAPNVAGTPLESALPDARP